MEQKKLPFVENNYESVGVTYSLNQGQRVTVSGYLVSYDIKKVQRERLSYPQNHQPNFDSEPESLFIRYGSAARVDSM